ncbi:hypothetical protein O181_023348 [Austropuccinia psidii MF-1]|uniref:Uncharacterized protein n=1 Tax=Austropuccinia psidii MF-1 TaxID=1389203 RepID=A0A9Q3CGW6_9BASI|nr:hypothetical protein [Austropuccinia psidii MF-1]
MRTPRNPRKNCAKFELKSPRLLKKPRRDKPNQRTEKVTKESRCPLPFVLRREALTKAVGGFNAIVIPFSKGRSSLVRHSSPTPPVTSSTLTHKDTPAKSIIFALAQDHFAQTQTSEDHRNILDVSSFDESSRNYPDVNASELSGAEILLSLSGEPLTNLVEEKKNKPNDSMSGSRSSLLLHPSRSFDKDLFSPITKHIVDKKIHPGISPQHELRLDDVVSQFLASKEFDIEDDKSTIFYAFIASLTPNVLQHNGIQDRTRKPLSHEILLQLQAFEDNQPRVIQTMSILKDLRDRMLYLNFTLLKTFKADSKFSNLKADQNAITETFTKLFSLKKVTIAVLNPDSSQTEENPHWLKKIQKFVHNSLQPQSKDHNSIIVFFKKFRKPETPLSRNQLLKTEIALNLVKSYYKTINSDKWEKLFENDQSFVLFLTTIARRFRTNHNKFFAPAFTRETQTLFPWSTLIGKNKRQKLERAPKTWFQNLENYSRSTWLEKWVIMEADSHYNVPQLDELRSSHLASLPPPEFSTSIKAIIQKRLQKFLSTLPQNSNGPAKLKILGHFVLEDGLEKKSETLLQALWYMNAKFIEIFGCHSLANDYLRAQVELQSWVQTNLLKRLLGEKELPSPIESQPEKRLEISAEKVQESLNSPEITVRRPLAQLGNLRWPENDVEKFKTAIDILGIYYKALNTQKWKSVYENDEDYLDSLLAFMRGLRPNVSSSSRRYDDLLNRKLRMIPWKTPMPKLRDLEVDATLQTFKFYLRGPPMNE